MRRLCGLILLTTACAVPPLATDGKLCSLDADECPSPSRCLAFETGESRCAEGCPPASTCNPTEGRACSSAAPCPATYHCARTRPDAGVCTRLCPSSADLEPFELNCTDALDNDCDGRAGKSRDVVLIDAPAEQPTWAWRGAAGYAAFFVRNERIYFQLFDSALVPAAAPLAVSEPGPSARDPLIIPLPNLTYGVVWLDTGAPDAGTQTRVLLATVDEAGGMPVAPRVLGGNAALRGRPRASWSRTVGTMMVMWIEGSNNAAVAVVMLPDGTIVSPRAGFPRSGGVLTNISSLDVTDRYDSPDFDAGFGAAWIQDNNSLAPHFIYVDREGDPLVGKVEMNGSGELSHIRTANTFLASWRRSFFVWSEYAGGQSTIRARSSVKNEIPFVLAGSSAVATRFVDLEVAISTDNDQSNYMDVSTVTADGYARILASTIKFGDVKPMGVKVQLELKADGRAPVIAIGGGRHGFAYQLDAGAGQRQIRAQLHCNP